MREPQPAYSRPGPGDADTGSEEEEANCLHQEIPKREVLPDPVHGTTVVTKLINQIMLDGKRGVAQNVCYQAFETVAEKTGKPAADVFQEALNNVAPQLEVKARRVGGATYQVPIPTRCLSKFVPSAVRRWPCAGSSTSPGNAVRRPWLNAWPES